jgi:hypothetical protein
MNLLISLLLIILGQSITYFQSQGQFFWPWAKENPLIMALLGVPVSLLFIYFAKYNALAFDGQVWPGRVIQFCVGTIVFALMSSLMMGEHITAKTGISLGLALLILAIQIFWK